MKLKRTTLLPEVKFNHEEYPHSGVFVNDDGVIKELMMVIKKGSKDGTFIAVCFCLGIYSAEVAVDIEDGLAKMSDEHKLRREKMVLKDTAEKCENDLAMVQYAMDSLKEAGIKSPVADAMATASVSEEFALKAISLAAGNDKYKELDK